MVSAQTLEVVEFALDAIGGDAKHHAKAAGFGGFFDRRGEVGEKGIADIRDNQPDRI